MGRMTGSAARADGSFFSPRDFPPAMTVLSFDEDGVDVEYEGTTFRMDRSLIEAATEKSYFDVTDHEVLRLVEKEPSLSGEARRISDILT